MTKNLPEARASFRRSALRSLTGALALVGALAATPAAALTAVSSFGSNPGNLAMYKHVPSSMPSNAPVVVALHGCTQSAAAYDAETGWVKMANTHKFYLVLPEQKSGNNQNKCFNWFELNDIRRGYGEALSIKQMVDKMKSSHSVDGNRVFVTGLSAGGFMTNVMLATYPDVFAGGAPIAGGPYKCATSMTAAFSCMSPGTNKSASAWGDLARSGHSSWSGRKPLVSIWHGTSDYTVKDMNLTEQMEQWTNYAGVDQTADTSNTVKGYPHKVYKTSGGAAKVETYSITSMGHGTPIDPGSNADQCGTAGAYILDVNICSSYFIAQFWGLTGGTTTPPPTGGDTTAPSVSITAPSNGATVSGTKTISASASDNVGVTKVEFYVNGSLKGTDTSSPYAYSWNTTTVANGSKTLMVKAHDAAGNTKSASISVTVSNTTSGWVCKETYTANYYHVQAGRAYASGGYAYAKGSNARMGLNNTYYKTRLAETSSGYFKIGYCP